ncbi:MAG: PrgI family protein [Clostridiales bacterium]|nr:PrgI family protein [Clostridiales bacterium]
MISLEVRINKEVRDYQESIFFGLSLRQCLFSALAILVAVACYFLLHHFTSGSQYDWVCVLAAFPFALGGFFRYNGMNAEQFLAAFLRSQLAYSRRLLFLSENLYARALERSSVKEALTLD